MFWSSSLIWSPRPHPVNLVADVDEVWRHTHEQRRALAALLGDLSDDEWAVLSLCEGWTVRDVAAHVIRSATVTPWESAVALVRFRGRYNVLVAEDARQAARWPVAELLAEFERHDGSRRRRTATYRAYTRAHLLELATRAGLARAHWVAPHRAKYFQPVMIAVRPSADTPGAT